MKLRARQEGKREATKILIAEDDAVTRLLLQRTLQHACYEVVIRQKCLYAVKRDTKTLITK